MIAYIFIGLFAAITIISHIVISIGIGIAGRREKTQKGNLQSTGGSTRSISIIIPARNEESTLPRLFTALESLNTQQYELVFVDDRSEDRTPQLLSDFRSKSDQKIKIVRINAHPEKMTLNPKQYALVQGINAAESDILLFTDADCSPPPDWISSMTAQFEDSTVGVCIGPIQTTPRKGFLYKFQHFDHIFRYFYTAGCTGFGMPTGGFGNNLAVRKQALDDIGGYENIGYSVTEDAALIVAIRDKTDFKIAASVNKDSLVTALPQDSWKVLATQERRWSYGAFRSPDFQTVFGYAAVMLFLFAGLAAIPLMFAFRPFFLIIISTFFSMLMVAVPGGLKIRAGFRSFWLFLLPSIFFSAMFYTFNNLLSFFNIPITWKGKDLDKM